MNGRTGPDRIAHSEFQAVVIADGILQLGTPFRFLLRVQRPSVADIRSILQSKITGSGADLCANTGLRQIRRHKIAHPDEIAALGHRTGHIVQHTSAVCAGDVKHIVGCGGDRASSHGENAHLAGAALTVELHAVGRGNIAVHSRNNSISGMYQTLGRILFGLLHNTIFTRLCHIHLVHRIPLFIKTHHNRDILQHSHAIPIHIDAGGHGGNESGVLQINQAAARIRGRHTGVDTGCIDPNVFTVDGAVLHRVNTMGIFIAKARHIHILQIHVAAIGENTVGALARGNDGAVLHAQLCAHTRQHSRSRAIEICIGEMHGRVGALRLTAGSGDGIILDLHHTALGKHRGKIVRIRNDDTIAVFTLTAVQPEHSALPAHIRRLLPGKGGRPHGRAAHVAGSFPG